MSRISDVRVVGRPIIDRCHADRDDENANRARWNDPAARLLLIDAHDRVVMEDGRVAAVPTEGERDDQRDLLLGVVDGVPWFARRSSELRPEAQSLRTVDLVPVDRELVMSAVAALAWHESNPVCPRCGQPTRIASGGLVRYCSRGHHTFPRTDPAIITAVLDDDDRIVLARQHSWDSHRKSVLAGFIEAGEPAEHAVVREVAEETSLTITSACYIGSQAWPFPRSLMFGYVARGIGTIDVGHDELAEADYFSREEVSDQVDAGHLQLPPSLSLARVLIDAWLEQRLPEPESGFDFSTC
ncbi:NAD(+) diphosphatase [Cutibacterium sp. WCA-380-WT-3A]|uniref:NAD(+) diphosphatase n=1 Tax=Cutibacterium porci TaxID=2605781 RepID=A0A7K0J606_9ACTN|nr:NAD(+) diphosphatase [Cutibacterium porci]MSS45375.1 NAD(+) diphosphatase [Cutibacterium porci]